jgi:hypothetical protein
MHLKILIICAFIGSFEPAGWALATSSGGGGGGHGGGGAAHAGAAHGAGPAREGGGHASAQLGSRIPIGTGTREESELARLGFVDAYVGTIGGHNATVAEFKNHPLTVSERVRLYRYHFKGFNECIGHGACPQPAGGAEMYCRRARNVAITSDLECLSFRPSD